MIYSKIVGGGGLTAQSSQPPAAKFTSQGDAYMRTDAQIKFLYYPLTRLCLHAISLFPRVIVFLRVQSCKLYYNKYMIDSTQIAKTEIFALIAVLVFNLWGCKVLFAHRKDHGSCQKVSHFLRK